MRYGICINLLDALHQGTLEERLQAIKCTGYSYVETVAAACEYADEEQLGTVKALLEEKQLVCSHANILFPEYIRLLGGEADPESTEKYLRKVFHSLSFLGVQLVSLGSGHARRVPEGMPYEEAAAGFCEAARGISILAEAYGIRIALEHLPEDSASLMTSVEEMISFCEQVGHENCGMLLNNCSIRSMEEYGRVLEMKQRLFHVHMASPDGKGFPAMADKEQLMPCVRSLLQSGYNGTISFEAILNHDYSYHKNIVQSIDLLQQCFSRS